MANTGKDCPLLAGLLEGLGDGTPATDSPLCGALRLALPPKFELPNLGVGGGDSPSPWLSLLPTSSKGLRALRFELLSVNSRGFMVLVAGAPSMLI